MKTKKSRLEVLLTLILVGSIIGCSELPETSLEVNSDLERLQSKSSNENPTYAGLPCPYCGEDPADCECYVASKCPQCGDDEEHCTCQPCSKCGGIPLRCTCTFLDECPNCKAPTENCQCPTCSECGKKPFYCDCPESSQPTPSVRCECYSARCSGDPATCTCKEADYCANNEECICRGHLGSITPTDPTDPSVTTTP